MIERSSSINHRRTGCGACIPGHLEAEQMVACPSESLGLSYLQTPKAHDVR